MFGTFITTIFTRRRATGKSPGEAIGPLLLPIGNPTCGQARAVTDNGPLVSCPQATARARLSSGGHRRQHGHPVLHRQRQPLRGRATAGICGALSVMPRLHHHGGVAKALCGGPEAGL
jgi:hypothetical protein